MRLVREAGRYGEAGLNLLLLAAVGIAAAVVYPQFSLNHDSSWYLVATAMFLDGSQLYTDILEINPPLAFYLTVPVVGAARGLGTDPTTIYILYCIAVALGSCVWTSRVLAKSDISAIERRGLFLAVVVALFALPIAEFGQREHLMLMLAMPFLVKQVLGTSASHLGVPEQLALGVMASLGLLLKPYFLLIPAAIAVMRLCQERNRRVFSDPGLLALAGATIFYLLFIVWAHPAYIELVVPMAREVYTSYGVETRAVVLRTETAAMILLGIAVWRSRLVADETTRLLAAASLAGALAYLLQFKGWNYQILPMSAFMIMATAWIAVRNFEAVKRDAVLVILLALAALLTLGVQLARGPYESATTAEFERFIESDGQSILVLSTNVSASFPFVNEVSGKWASRYSAQWLIPGAHDRLAREECRRGEEACARSEEILDYARSSIIEDMERFEPSIVFVDERAKKSYYGDSRFDYFAFLSADARFRNLLLCYRRIGEALDYGVFANICRSMKSHSPQLHKSNEQLR